VTPHADVCRKLVVMADEALRGIAAAIRSMVHARPRGTPPDITEARKGYSSLGKMIPIADGAMVEDVDANGVACEWIATPKSEAGRVVLYLHGGCYVIGSRRSHRSMLSRLADTSGGRVLSVEYRLAPEHAHPAAMDDAVNVWRWLLAQGVAPGRVAFAGDSAGGGLVLATLVAARDAGLPMPAAAVCLSPWTDLELTGVSVRENADTDAMLREDDLRYYASLYLADQSPRAPLASPLHADLRGLPPLLLHASTTEVLRDDSARLADRARAAGVDVTFEEFDSLLHVWHFFAGMARVSDEAMGRVADFVRART
jgi:monoterpene epsilon-lactone hydrolase